MTPRRGEKNVARQEWSSDGEPGGCGEGVAVDHGCRRDGSVSGGDSPTREAGSLPLSAPRDESGWAVSPPLDWRQRGQPPTGRAQTRPASLWRSMFVHLARTKYAVMRCACCGSSRLGVGCGRDMTEPNICVTEHEIAAQWRSCSGQPCW
ncbi:hypothetical protein VFPFJ_09559 [Purpureocillium lilacinum]|uniref:Uncharacterized protein n=1 Tax=Purpureocillium lilacinum TaxID=33203 RepID=A0A179GCC5_PURLI|nr:hypothetical protein VFPFJ_09559 [Purpureocillium lilacinum]OAQ75477.1 hypothetical protein VFPBJ_09450 [Purpureocillium lilacinum]OAQ81104.1 hypothetical protein VFPFJ_09559 [Purpureocillium lilacinum]